MNVRYRDSKGRFSKAGESEYYDAKTRKTVSHQEIFRRTEKSMASPLMGKQEYEKHIHGGINTVNYVNDVSSMGSYDKYLSYYSLLTPLIKDREIRSLVATPETMEKLRYRLTPIIRFYGITEANEKELIYATVPMPFHTIDMIQDKLRSKDMVKGSFKEETSFPRDCLALNKEARTSTVKNLKITKVTLEMTITKQQSL